jgi:hypothetical protein
MFKRAKALAADRLTAKMSSRINNSRRPSARVVIPSFEAASGIASAIETRESGIQLYQTSSHRWLSTVFRNYGDILGHRDTETQRMLATQIGELPASERGQRVDGRRCATRHTGSNRCTNEDPVLTWRSRIGSTPVWLVGPPSGPTHRCRCRASVSLRLCGKNTSS